MTLYSYLMTYKLQHVGIHLFLKTVLPPFHKVQLVNHDKEPQYETKHHLFQHDLPLGGNLTKTLQLPN